MRDTYSDARDLSWTGKVMLFFLAFTQQTPLIIAGNEEQKKKYLGRLMEEPLLAVSAIVWLFYFKCADLNKICLVHSLGHFGDVHKTAQWRVL